MTKYPNIKVTLVGQDGNAFSIMGRVVRSLKEGLRGAGFTNEKIKEEIESYQKEAMSGNYDNLLMTTMNWVEVE